MADILIAAAAVVPAITAVGLFATWRRAAAVEKMRSVQLVGTGAVAVLLLVEMAEDEPAVLDAALRMALLAAFAAAAFRAAALHAGRRAGGDGPR